ncbi:YjdF family protein [Labedaea rhizosphaerae]|uniref:DUF2992 family protein n=1 Tax=Labedaea rhizosphaerae TaxID=598644 RepID=A0A4R6S4R0_LABRH|nr:YjdF family protein [Labedaea rhizosphaerae]TDP93726.1 DUF2992 family protein [Labedaea rhizosphaerae]
MSATFSVFHDGQFWVGVLELHDEDGVRAARHVFGPEPGNAELLEFCTGSGFLDLSRQAHAAPLVPEDQRPVRKLNPKRLARAARKALEDQPVGTAAQRALKESFVEHAAGAKAQRKQRREAAKERRRDMARAKAKAKHRGH